MARHVELAAPEIRIIPARLELAADLLAGALVGAVALPGIGIAGAPIHAGALSSVLAVMLSAAAAFISWKVASRAILTYAVAELAVFISCFLLNDASYPGSGFVVAALFGAGMGPLLPRGREAWPRWAPAAIGGFLFFTWVRARAGVGEAALLAAMLTFAAVATALAARRYEMRMPGRTKLLAGGTAIYAAFAVFWVGSTAPGVQWFGSLEFHGPRNVNEVAITFDDGPNPPYTLRIADILEEYDARGTFFEVGRAVVERPDVTKELVARGHVVGNHSYTHGAVSYLDPDYPELEQTQQAFRDHVGVCPAIFRPPHGTHTPFMSKLVDDAGMTLVTWDVSAKDWVETDPDLLAKHILERVRPGSVILLHDGIDGDIGADRSVVEEALPIILQGLEDKGLKPVTLDRLLGVPAYLPDCE